MKGKQASRRGERLSPSAESGTKLGAVLAAWIGGILLAGTGLPAGPWFLSAAVFVTFGLLLGARPRLRRAWRCWGLLALVAVSAGWAVLRSEHIGSDHIARFAEAGRQLVKLVGTVQDEPALRSSQAGAFAGFSYEAPVTLALLRVERILDGGRWRSCSGRLLLRIAEADHRLLAGDRIVATGWLAPISGPQNPGERDFRLMFRRRGVDGRLFLPVRGNWQLLARGAGRTWAARQRDAFARAALYRLRTGLDADPRRSALLETILLGRRDRDVAELAGSFREVGLAHLLSISGAHLGMLLLMVWWAAGALVGRPRVAAVAVLITLSLFLAVVPWRVPIIRAGIMAAAFAGAYGFGRRVAAIDLLAGAALVVLVWEPSQLFGAGFQLSFGAVAALLLYARPVTRWLHGLLPVALREVAVLRLLARYLALNLVAFLAVLPLVAYHFELITPWAPLVALAAVPAVGLTLVLGYVKVFGGLLLPTLGWCLAWPLMRVADGLLWLVDGAGLLPGSTLLLDRPPTVAWVLAATAVAVALLGGRFARRPAAAAGAVGLCALWLLLLTSDAGPSLPGRNDTAALRLHTLAVADGSCHFLRIDPAAGGRRPMTLMFDCGSQQYLDIARKTVLPALRRLGVARIDVLVISHADLDHFGGVLDLAARMPVRRVLMPPHVQREAAADPASTSAFLLDGLAGLGLDPEPVARGWTARCGIADLAVLWPPADFAAAQRNDTSVVLRVSTAGRRLLLCGDIQGVAIDALLAAGADLRGDVCDLPHHGGFVEQSSNWLAAVGPRLVLQSCGRARLGDDRWPPLLERHGIRRLITARDGMASVAFDRSGRITWSTFAGAVGEIEP